MAGIALEMHRDGRLYPPSGRLEPAERNRAINQAHALVCSGGLSIRAAQAVMLSRGIRRSVGIIHRDLANFACRACDPGNPAFRSA
jgi:hypothetical protein